VPYKKNGFTVIEIKALPWWWLVSGSYICQLCPQLLWEGHHSHNLWGQGGKDSWPLNKQVNMGSCINHSQEHVKIEGYKIVLVYTLHTS